MRNVLNTVLLLGLAVGSVLAQTPVAPQPAAPRVSPTRDAHTPGYVDAKDMPDGANAPADADGNFILGPTHNAAPELAVPGSPLGTIIEFTMSSTDSKMYPGIARDPHTFGTPDPGNPAKLIVTTSSRRKLVAPAWGRRAIRRRTSGAWPCMCPRNMCRAR